MMLLGYVDAPKGEKPSAATSGDWTAYAARFHKASLGKTRLSSGVGPGKHKVIVKAPGSPGSLRNVQ